MRYSYSTISAKVYKGVAFLKLHTPGGMRDMALDTKKELADFLRKAKNDAGIRAILLTGHGKVFYAGDSLRVGPGTMQSRGTRKAKNYTT